MKKNVFLLFFAAILSGCNANYFIKKNMFTQPVKETLMQTDKELPAKLQYYTDTRVKLRYVSTSQQNFVTQGKAQFKRGKYIYTFIIPKYTACVAKNVKGDTQDMYVDGNNYLQFYAIKESEGDRVCYFLKTEDSTTLYEGKVFTVLKGANVRLKYRRLDNYKEDKAKGRAKGVKVQ